MKECQWTDFPERTRRNVVIDVNLMTWTSTSFIFFNHNFLDVADNHVPLVNKRVRETFEKGPLVTSSAGSLETLQVRT